MDGEQEGKSLSRRKGSKVQEAKGEPTSKKRGRRQAEDLLLATCPAHYEPFPTRCERCALLAAKGSLIKKRVDVLCYQTKCELACFVHFVLSTMLVRSGRPAGRVGLPLRERRLTHLLRRTHQFLPRLYGHFSSTTGI